MSDNMPPEYLEAISAKIRRGEPVSFPDAIAAIDYQEGLRKWKKKQAWWRRMIRWLKRSNPESQPHE